MRTAFLWLTAALVLLLASVLIDTARAAPRDGLQHALAPFVGHPVPGMPVQAAVLLQKKDCSGNLRVFDIMQSAQVRPNLTLAVIWYVGPVADSSGIRLLLPHWTSRIPLTPAPPEALRELAHLGHDETPTIVVLDQNGRIRFTSRSPRSLREYAGLRRIIEGLTWMEEL